MVPPNPLIVTCEMTTRMTVETHDLQIGPDVVIVVAVPVVNHQQVPPLLPTTTSGVLLLGQKPTIGVSTRPRSVVRGPNLRTVTLQALSKVLALA